MSAVEKNAHIWDRHPEDWYVEPEWCSRRLFEVEHFGGAIHDPSCGLGRIVASAQEADYLATGSDIVARSHHATSLCDFLTSKQAHDNIVSNPPFGIADAYAKHALAMARNKVALLLPTKWMNSARRGAWLETTPLIRVHLLAPRPSMPPGPVIEAGVKPGNGTTDFAWFVWQTGHEGTPTICWLRRDPSPRPSMAEARNEREASDPVSHKPRLDRFSFLDGGEANAVLAILAGSCRAPEHQARSPGPHRNDSEGVSGMISTLRTLLDRVEQGEGADMALNWDIADAFGMVPAHRIVETGFDYDWYRKAGDHALWKANDSEGRNVSLWQPANVTGSIDAAVAIVEKVLPGWVWTMAHWWCEGDSKPPFYADLCELEKAKADDDTAIIARAWSSSPARALVAALLRAKIAQEEGE